MTRWTEIFLGLLFVIAAFCPAGAQQPPDSPSSPLGPLSPRTGLLLKDGVVVRLIQASSGDQAFDSLARLALWHRLQVSDGYSQAAEWVSEKAREAGLEQVGIERFPSDGKIEYFGQISERRWTVKRGELWLTSPFSMKLASYADLPMSLAIASTSADIEAEIVDIGAGADDKDYAAGVKGKIVLTTEKPLRVFGRAVTKEGAAGMISSWSASDVGLDNSREGDFPDQVGWQRIPEEGADAPGHFAFGLSARRGRELRALLRQGQPVRVRALIDAELGPGHLEVVGGVIPGVLYPNEEIIVTAHLDHYRPGANDNASGSAAILEMARTLCRLIEDKELPPPLRTIRFLWVPEYAGTTAWLSKHLDDHVRRLADLNFDMVGENAEKTNAVITVCRTSDSNPSFLNGLVESILDFVNTFNEDRYPARQDFSIGSLNGSRQRAAWRMTRFNAGSDHDLFNKLGIGTTSMIAWPDDYYHSREDSPDKADPTQLHRAVVLGLAALATLAYVDSEQAPDLARLALLYGRRRIAGDEFAAVRSLMSSAKDGWNEADALATNLMAHAFVRERASVGSAAVLARTPRARSGVQKAVSLLDADEAASRKRLDDLAGQLAAGLGMTRSPKPLTMAERRAARLVPGWIKGKELFTFEYVQRILDKDPTARLPEILAGLNESGRRLRERGLNELELYGFMDAASLYADGQRSILDICDAMAAEYAAIAIGALELYFRAFEKAGLMTLLEE